MLKRLAPQRGYEDSAPGAASEEGAGLDPREVINFVWRQWKFIAGVVALALLIGALYVARQTPLYTASTQLLLDPRKEKAAGQDVVLADISIDQPWIESQISVINSTALLRRVVVKENLINDPEFGSGPVIAGGGLLASIRGFFSGSPVSTLPQTPSQPPAGESGDLTNLAPDLVASIQNVQGAVGVTRAGQALVLNVSFTSADPNKAAKLANAVADAYVVDKLDARFEAAKRAEAWLSDRLVDLKKQLHDSEEAVAQFRAANNLKSGGTESATLTQDQLGQLNGRLVAARAEYAEKKARADLLQKVLAAGGSIADMGDVANSGAMGDLRKQENDLKRQEADLVTRYNDRHPAVVNIRAQLADVRRSIVAEATRIANDAVHDYQLAAARQAAIEKTLKEVSGETDLDAQKAITLRELERNAAVNKGLFEDFLQRSRVTEEQSTFEVRDARVITPALAPAAPSYPKRGIIFGASLVIGLIVGAGGAYLIELLNAGFTTPRQVEDSLGMPLLASISRMEARDLSTDGGVITMPQYPFVKPLSRFSEAIRSLRSAIQMSDVDNPPKVLQVTSTIPGEGKSTIAMTLAASAAQSGQKAIIIDGDLRHPSTSRYFKTEEGQGLVDYLVGTAEVRNLITYVEDLHLWVLPAGSKTQNPPDLLGSERFKALVSSLKTQFDLVVIDSPPMGPVVDPLIVSQTVDKVVFVVRWAKTAREMVAHSIERLAGHRKVAGVVFNYVIDAQAQKYGKYAYSYYYGGRYYKKYYHE